MSFAMLGSDCCCPYSTPLGLRLSLFSFSCPWPWPAGPWVWGDYPRGAGRLGMARPTGAVGLPALDFGGGISPLTVPWIRQTTPPLDGPLLRPDFR